jgi:hypothetical protein
MSFAAVGVASVKTDVVIDPYTDVDEILMNDLSSA